MTPVAGAAVNRLRRCIALAGAAAPVWISRTLDSLAAGAGFPVFDALNHPGKPNLSRQGLEHMVSVSQIWRPGAPKGYVDERGVVAILERLPYEVSVISLDIEDWPILGVAENLRTQHIENYLLTAKIARRTKPHIKFGFYGIAPLCVYWPIANQDQQQLAEWRAANRALRPLAEWVDFVLPSLYTFYDDPAGWRQFAIATLEEARQYGKPVYPFLWFEYFDGNLQLRGRDVKLADWREELTICQERADGLVLWSNQERNWSESAGWWQAVLEMPRKKANTPAAVGH
jgi:hypothetical protein